MGLRKLPEHCLSVRTIHAVVIKGSREGWVMYYVGSDGDLLAICVRNVPPKDTHIVKVVLITILDVIACAASVEECAPSGILAML